MRHQSAAIRTIIVASALLVPRPGSSQPVPNPVTSGSAGGARWSAGAGYETLSLRDIARTTRPVTASPVAWEGSGPAFRGRVAWDNGRRLHQIDFGGSLSGGFKYRTPLRSDPTSDLDEANYFEGRYEYRRYPFRDLMMRGFDFGLGVEGLGALTTFRRRISPDIDIHESRLNAGVGGSLVARLRRWQPVGLELAWTNGLVIGHRSDEWSLGAEASGGGGGWLTTLSARADVRMTGNSALYVSFADSGEGFFSSHRSYALTRRRLAMGVAYGR